MKKNCLICCEGTTRCECITYTGHELPIIGVTKGDNFCEITKKINDTIGNISGLNIDAGNNITITGTGTTEDPIIISSTTFENPLSFLTGLTRTGNNVRANISTGVSGGQVAWGGVAAGENLTLSSTTSSTKGKVILGISATDDLRFTAYPNTRNDGNATMAFYPDASGNIKLGPIVGGSGSNTVDNGLTENPAGNFQLGSDTLGGGTLLHDTYIALNGKTYNITEGLAPYFHIDGTNQLGAFGDYNSGGPMYFFNVVSQTVQLTSAPFGVYASLYLDGVAKTSRLGDAGGGNLTTLTVDDANQSIAWVEGSLPGASLGFVWALSDTVTGKGAWAAISGTGTVFESIFSGTGLVTSFTIPHGLVGVPKAVVTAGSADAANISYITIDATNITVNYAVAPPVGTNNITINWIASL